MKQVLGAFVAAMTFAAVSHASAADLPYKAAPMVAPAFSWTGYYFGVNVGYGVGRDSVSTTTVSGAGFPVLGAGSPLYSPDSDRLSPSGWNGGGQIGYNFEFSPRWIAGIEADIQGSAMKDTNNCLMPCGVGIVSTPIFSAFPVTFSQISAEHQINWFGTLRGRLGYSFGPWFVYGTGGLAYGEVERSGRVIGATNFFLGNVNTFSGSYDNSSIKTGWTAGVGTEGKLFGNWSLKAEYLYVDLGSATDTFSTIYGTCNFGCTPGTVAATRTDVSNFREHIFRVGLNYKLGG